MVTSKNFRYPCEKAMILLFPVITLSIIGAGAFLFVMGPALLKPLLGMIHL